MIRRRLLAASAVLALCAALAFSLLALLFLYTIEDSFFDRMLEQEAAHQQQAWRAQGQAAAPMRSFVTLHRSRASFPPELASWTRGTEIGGRQGRHYHVRALTLDGAPAWLVAEVSGELVVRPRLPFILGVLGACAALLLVLALALAKWMAGFIEREQQFTRDASHELRTPLAVIEGAAELLATAPLAPQQSAQLQRIRAAATQMAHSIDTLLALARQRIEGSQNVPLLALAEELVLQFGHLIDGQHVELAIDPGDSVCTHRAALAILLGNLISNAFSHGGAGTVRIAREGAYLVVRDQGPGIDPAIGARLFEAGVKGAGSGGSGLGLSIARRLGQRAGIGLAIESSAAGTVARLGPFP